MAHKYQPGLMYRMPIGYGPAMGPRQGPEGRKFSCEDNPKTTSLAVSYRSDAAQIQALLPEGFELDGDPVVTVQASYMKEIEWLAGRGYNTLGVTFPAMYQGRGESVRGPFLSVLWENLADPIITGREELGFAKVYCELPEPDLASASARATAGWQGFDFMNMALSNLQRRDPPPAPNKPIDGTLHYKYMPRTGFWTEPDTAYAVLTPAHTPNRKIVERWSGDGTVAWTRARWQDLPTLYPIVNALADLEIVEILSATLTKTIGGKDLSDQRIVE